MRDGVNVPDLSQLAAVARRALGADAVLMVSRTMNLQAPRVGAAGLTNGELRTLGRELTRGDTHLEHSTIVEVPAVRGCDVPYAGALTRHGFLSALFAAVGLDGAHAGELYALRRTEGRWHEQDLALVFARHAAATIAHSRLREDAARLNERLGDRDALDELVLSATDFRDLSRKLNEHVAPLFGAQLTGIMVWDEDREVLQMVSGSFNADEELVSSYQIGGSDAHSNAARVFATGRPYLSNDARGDPGILQDYVAAFRIESTLSVPLRAGECAIGVLHIANKPGPFTTEDVQRAEMLAPRIASVVQVARTMFRLRRQHAIESTLSHLATTIASGRSVRDILEPALVALCESTEANVIAVVSDGSAPVVGRSGAEHAGLEAALLEAAAGARVVNASATQPAEPRDTGRAMLLLPVQFGGQRLGAVGALRLRGMPFMAYERSALERLASLTALACTSERYQQQRAKLMQLEERDRIADDVHDDVAQILFGAQIGLDRALERSDLGPEVAELVLAARRLVVKGDATLRDVAHRLAPPAGAGFPARLRSVAAAMEKTYGLPVALEITDAAATAAAAITMPLATSLLEVAREALLHTAEHAGATPITVRLDLDDETRLRMVVDGDGRTDLRALEQNGLASVRRAVERQGGTLGVGDGSTVTVTATVPRRP